MKKFASILLSLVLVVAMCAVGVVPASAEDHTYFAVGAAPLFDPAWTPDAPNYQMFADANGVFTVTIPVTEDMWDSDVAYKVAQDGTWDVSYNDRGEALGLDTNAYVYIEEGTTAVVITFDLTTLCTAAVCTTGEEPTEAPTAAPTEAPTEAPTAAPTEDVTSVVDGDHTYFAVGAAPLFDPAWTPDAADYQMTQNAEGIYMVGIPVTEDMWDSDVAYKVAQDGGWDVSFNDRGEALGLDTNAYVYIEEGATAVIITFDPSTLCTSAVCVFAEAPTEAPTAAPTEAPTADVTEEPTTPAFDVTADHTYTAVGAAPLFDPAWDPAAAAYQLTDEDGDGVYSVTIPVREDMWDSDVAYKVAADNAWDFSFNDRGEALGLDTNAYVYIEENTTAVVITFSTATLCTTATCVMGEVVAPTEAPTAEAPTADVTEPTEAPTVVPTEVTTDEATEAPTAETTEAPTADATEAPTTEATVAPTEAPTADKTDAPTEAPTEDATKGADKDTTTGKVATGDSSSVAMLLVVLMFAAATVVVARKRIAD